MALEDSHEAWLADAVTAIVRLSLSTEIFDADDVRAAMRPPPHPNLPGIAFTTAKRAGHIEAVAHSTSTARSRKNGSLRTWTRKKEQP